MLTPEQIAFFQKHGYLILENFVDSEIIEGWREQIWKHFNSSLETQETWPNDYVVQNFSFSPLFGQLPCDARDYSAARWRTIRWWRRFTARQMAQP